MTCNFFMDFKLIGDVPRTSSPVTLYSVSARQRYICVFNCTKTRLNVQTPATPRDNRQQRQQHFARDSPECLPRRVMQHDFLPSIHPGMRRVPRLRSGRLWRAERHRYQTRRVGRVAAPLSGEARGAVWGQ